MSIPKPRALASQQTLEDALQWFELLRDDDVPESKVLAWLSWYEANEANSRAFDELQDFWRLSQELNANVEGQLYIEQMQRYSGWERCKWRAESWFAGKLSEAAGSILSRLWHPAIGWSVGIAAAVVMAIVLAITPDSKGPTAHNSTTVAPQRGLVRAMTLPDDSKVELAPNTTIALAYSDVERRLDMSAGEANFVVAPNKKRPFIVQVDTLRVRAVGTQFNIHRVAERVVVTVIEGTIDVYRDGDSSTNSVVRVSAGQQFVATGRSDAGSLVTYESQEVLKWREGRLRYVNVPLAAVIADVNRYVARPIVISDDKLGSLTYTGTVFAEAIQEWLGAIPREFPLVVVTESDRTVLMPSRLGYDNAQ